jgi:hypothetical protein
MDGEIAAPDGGAALALERHQQVARAAADIEHHRCRPARRRARAQRCAPPAQSMLLRE